jgi:prolyl oligopeptidase
MLIYPDAKRLDLMEAVHGTAVADPYRWLEDGESPETKAWTREQAMLARPFLEGLPGRDAFRHRLRDLLVGYVGLPFPRGDRVFFARRQPDEDLPVLLLTEPDGTERVLIDPHQLSDDHTVTLDSWRPSPDGTRLAYNLSRGGDEETTLYVIDVESGDLLDTPVDRTRFGSFAWMPDGASYYYVRRLPPDQVPPGEAEYHRRVWLRRIGADPDSDQLIFGDGRDKVEFYSVDVSADGRWLIIHANKGNASANDLYVADLHDGGKTVAVIENNDSHTFGSVADDDGQLYLHTNLDAPNWRLAVVDPVNPGPVGWRDLLVESDAVLDFAFPTPDAIVAIYTQHAIAKLTIHDRGDGRMRSEVPLPGPGTVAQVSTANEVAGRVRFWFAYTDFVTPPRSYRYDIPTANLELHAVPPGQDDVPLIEASQIFYTSKDGTRVPMFILHRKGLTLDGRRPTILYGYGGWGASMVPAYRASAVAWIEQGGVYAIANIRGGGEYGEAWHRDGKLENKQNVFDDFVAAGEWLIDHGYTSSDHLGIEGGSNGGILVGACLTQRPDLFASVVCLAPVLDMLRFDKAPGGEISFGELGNPHLAEEFEYLYAYSPYHRVRDGVDYPAVLFGVFESDIRVPPWHARKMCAALQHATRSDRPILFRSEDQVGHAGRSVTRSIDLTADTLSFHASMLGLNREE